MREVSTALITLRAKQMGFTIDELSLISLGFFYEMLTESDNDHFDYPLEATQENIDSFW